MARSGRHAVVVIALIANLCITASKFVAAAFTGSAAIASEGVHSLADSANELLLLYGLRRAGAPPDPRHPFGHGREAYFWSFIVALLILIVGASVSFHQGLSRLGSPHPLTHVAAIYAVLAISFVVEGFSWLNALKRIRRAKGALGYYAAFRRSKDPGVFTVLLEDSAALLGIAIALAGTVLTQATGRTDFDAAASIVIAGLLCATSFLLARETKGLLIGEPATPELQRSILDIAFEDALTAPAIESCVERIESAIRARHPDVVAVYVKPQRPEVWQVRRRSLIEAGGGG
jgi:cation diffusion facilitator family transporter